MKRKPSTPRDERRAAKLQQRRDERKALPAKHAAARVEQERQPEQQVEPAPAEAPPADLRPVSLQLLRLISMTMPLAMIELKPSVARRVRRS